MLDVVALTGKDLENTGDDQASAGVETANQDLILLVGAMPT